MGALTANPLAPIQAMESPGAGVLAGIAFLAIMLVVNRQHRRGSAGDAAREYEQDNRFVTALACAFLGLVTAAALFALYRERRGVR
jgi:cbb3-type cytochrome oxidase subunit 3